MAITISGENNNDRILAQDGVIDSISGFNIAGIITASSFTGDLTGDVTGNLTGNVTGNINNTTLLLQTGGSERVRIDSSGRIGLGIANPGDYFSSYNRVVMGRTNDTGGMTIVSSTTSGGYISFADGTSGNQAYRGMISYQHGQDAMTFNTDSTEKLRITSGGTVGINDSSPNTYFKLDVNGHTNIVGDVALPTTNRIYFGNSDTSFIKGEHGGSAYLAFGANNEKMRLTRAGNLGIGTDAPNALLHVEKDGTSQVLARFESNMGTNNNRHLSLTSPTSDSASLPFTFSTGNSIQFKCDTNIVHIDDNGRIGIGTDSPQRDVDIISATNSQDVRIWSQGLSSNSNLLLRTGNSGGAGIKFGDTADEDIGKIFYSNSTDSLRFTVNASERFIIFSNGDISCGGAADNNIYNDTSGGGINFKNGGQLVIAKQASSGADPLVWLNDTGQTTNKFLLFAQDGTEKASIGLAGNDLRFARDGYNETLRITSGGQLLVNATTVNAGGANPQMAIDVGDSNLHGLTIQAGGGENNGDLAGIAFGQGNTGDIARPKAAIAHNRTASYGIGDLCFYVDGTADNNAVSSGDERLRITSDGRVLINSTASRNIGSNISRMLQVESSGGGAGIAVVRNSDNTSGPTLDLGKSRGYPHTIVQSGDKLGVINFSGADGTDLQTTAVQIIGEVDGTPGSNDMPGRLVFKTTADGGSSSTERLRISSVGHVTKPDNPAFFARPPGNHSITGDQIIGGTWSTSDSEAFVRGTLANGTSIWDNSTGIFTVPVTGIYYFHWNVFLKNNTTRRDAMIYHNGTAANKIIARTEIGEPNGTTGTNKNVSVTAVVSLSVNDTIQFGCLTTGSNQVIYQTAKPWSYACGYLIG